MYLYPSYSLVASKSVWFVLGAIIGIGINWLKTAAAGRINPVKIAAVTDDNRTISAHFGRATKYQVITVKDGYIVAREQREKASHRDFQREGLHGQHEHGHEENPQGRGFGKHSAEKHQRMFAAINDCQVLLTRGMGRGAYNGLQQMDIRPILTDISDIEKAVAAVMDGSIEDLTDRLH